MQSTNTNKQASTSTKRKGIFGSLQDRVLEVKDGLITITSLSKPLQCFTSTPIRWGNFMSYFSKLNYDVKELNKKTREVNTVLHIKDVSIRFGILRVECVSITVTTDGWKSCKGSD